jgi:hypothetical protein
MDDSKTVDLIHTALADFDWPKGQSEDARVPGRQLLNFLRFST